MGAKVLGGSRRQWCSSSPWRVYETSKPRKTLLDSSLVPHQATATQQNNWRGSRAGRVLANAGWWPVLLDENADHAQKRSADRFPYEMYVCFSLGWTAGGLAILLNHGHDVFAKSSRTPRFCCLSQKALESCGAPRTNIGAHATQT